MILYELKCPADHSFEGWFRNSDTYDEQRLAGEIACPVCGDTQVEKAMMAPRLARPAPVPTKTEIVQALRTIRQAVETSCENVGDNFAEEARKIHYGETDQRGIYGNTTPDEAEALADEGIEFSRIPWVPPTDS